MIEYVGNNALVEGEKVIYSFEVAENPRDFSSYRTRRDTFEWTEHSWHIGEWKIHPYGDNNDLPRIIKETVFENNLAPGVLKKKTGILWGKGPKLYREIFEERKLVKAWTEDEEVQAWLDSWDFESYLLAASVDFNFIEGIFTRFILSKGSRVGKPFIHKLEHISPARARLASRMVMERPTKPTHIVVTDWTFERISSLLEYKVYPLFEYNHPFKHRHSVFYSNMYSFCTDYYTVPDLYGSLEWLRRSTATPLILKAFAKNSLNVKYHIISPKRFWDDKEEELKEQCTKKGQNYKRAYLEEYKTRLLTQISKVLSGEENVGKFWHTTKDLTVEGTNLLEWGWEIKPIDQKVKEFIEAQIQISKRADHALSAGIGVHSALGNVSESGKSDSGSEQFYALKNYLLTGIDIPEMIITKALNYALKANFPGKKLKIGFYHIAPEREEDVTESQRIKNQ